MMPKHPSRRRSSLALGLSLGLVASLGSAGAERPPVATNHWAFQPLATRPGTVDDWVGRRLRSAGIAMGPEADRATLIRRVAFLVTGLPPTPEEVTAFQADRRPGATARMVENYLGSARYGERWGKHWLDAAGYADSNGYFNADTDRPLAYRYRDYVIRSLNQDKPWDRFVQEQLAGDELSGWRPGEPVSVSTQDLLVATHFLRNGQDGSGESDGNPDEVRVDRYYALESSLQILGSSLLGMTLQCAKCHDHKFEPVTQRDYYALQSILYPAFHVEKWIKPNDRVVDAALPGEREAWEAAERELDAEAARLRGDLSAWIREHRPPGRILFEDGFSDPRELARRWSNTAPGDDAPGGSPPVNVGGDTPPSARAQAGALEIREGGGSGDRWLCTQAAFDWRPERPEGWVQVTFDLLSLRLGESGPTAERVGYFIAAHDFDDSSPVAGGNILIDGNPGGPTAVQVDYPGTDAKGRGTIGATGYQSGHNYGVRVTRTGADDFRLEHLVDGVVDGASIALRSVDLPRGAFGFEYCCGRSFRVDNVRLEASDDATSAWASADAAYRSELTRRKKEHDDALGRVATRRRPRPGRVAWMTDVGPEAPEVHLLKRGNPQTPGEAVSPAILSLFTPGHPEGRPLVATPTRTTTGRRRAWAEWLTEEGSPQSALLARVTVNRVWQQYFGVGLVSTPDNLGLSGARPTHPELLDGLARGLVDSGWSLKALHRQILLSATFRQSSVPRVRALARDPANQLLSRFPVRRLDAEAIRDALLAVSGRLASKADGPYVPTPRTGTGEVVVDESHPEAFARTVFLQNRRTQVPTFLGNFDAPALVFNCTRRAETTMPLQSLSLLNSDFAVRRGEDLARRLDREVGATDEARLRRAFLLALGRGPDASERAAALRMLRAQRAVYAGVPEAEKLAWSDFCQTLFGLNTFLYLE